LAKGLVGALAGFSELLDREFIAEIAHEIGFDEVVAEGEATEAGWFDGTRGA